MTGTGGAEQRVVVRQGGLLRVLWAVVAVMQLVPLGARIASDGVSPGVVLPVLVLVGAVAMLQVEVRLDAAGIVAREPVPVRRYRWADVEEVVVRSGGRAAGISLRVAGRRPLRLSGAGWQYEGDLDGLLHEVVPAHGIPVRRYEARRASPGG